MVNLRKAPRCYGTREHSKTSQICRACDYEDHCGVAMKKMKRGTKK